LILAPSDRTGRHDGPEWQRITATAIKDDAPPSMPVIFTRGGVSRRFDSIADARKATGISWCSINACLTDGQPRCGYTISLAPKETR
jgi:hypothetical protein